jgi:hypothetical protein
VPNNGANKMFDQKGIDTNEVKEKEKLPSINFRPQI